MVYVLILGLLLTALACDRPGIIAAAIKKALAASDTALQERQTIDLTLETADGLTLAATLYPGSGTEPRPGLLLLHMLGSNRNAWGPTAQRLAEAGYTALALDLRGHGDSDGPTDWSQAAADVLRAWQFLIEQEGVDGTKTAIIGSSIGANLALVAAAESRINTVVLLSPGLTYAGITTDDAIVRYGYRPALIVASEEDTYAADSSQQLKELAVGGTSRFELLQSAGHGTDMLGREASLTDTIIAWLATHLSGVALEVANVRSIVAKQQGDNYNFSVGITSPDLGCNQYADWWEVLSNDGTLLYRRVLLHSHVDEQPFVRSGGPVSLDPEQTVWIRAHMFPQGYGGTAFVGSIGDGFRPAGLFSGFAPQAASLDPLPEDCAF